ncbi:MAG: cupin [Acidimicrobiia bacterium]|nr:cupin [Acidimicrobiia bacterium]
MDASSRHDAQPIAPLVEAVDLDATVGWFADELGFRIEAVSPADSPVEISMSGLGGRVIVRRADRDAPTRFVFQTDDAALLVRSPLRAPNGSVVEVRPTVGDVVVPDARPSLSVVRAADASRSDVGRAGMHYRDLLPDRWGGRFIASQITIPDGGDVPDWVHYHRVRFQMIFCSAGWVDVVYEDQGPPFRLEAGDCVVQPPEIRHRVLRASPGLEVIEIGCPAVHDTMADHALDLPNTTVDHDRDFGGQRFVRHVAAETSTGPWIARGLRCRDTGIARATGGLAGAMVLSADGTEPPHDPSLLTHRGEFLLDVVLAGSAELHVADDSGRELESLARLDAVALPSGVEWWWSRWTPDFEVLEVSLAAEIVRPA